VSNYSNTVKHWIENSDYNISEEKKKAFVVIIDIVSSLYASINI